jgi:RNA polymerase sigma-70 factor (ECF subfamily)
MTVADPFEAFLREYEDMVFGTAVRLLGNAPDAEDVSQTVFLKAFERFAQLEHSPTAAGWLKAVTTNACLNHLSRYRFRWTFFSELGAAAHAEAGDRPKQADWPAPAVEPSAELDRASRDARLERELAALPDHQRVPLVLFHFEQMSYQDIAAALRVSVGKVKTDIHRGRERLKHVLSDWDR